MGHPGIFLVGVDELARGRDAGEVVLGAGSKVVEVDEGWAEDGVLEAAFANGIFNRGLRAIVAVQADLFSDFLIPHVPVPRAECRGRNDRLDADLLAGLDNGLGLLGLDAGDGVCIEEGALAALGGACDLLQVVGVALEDGDAWLLEHFGLYLCRVADNGVDFGACFQEVLDGPLALVAGGLGDEVGSHGVYFLCEEDK